MTSTSNADGEEHVHFNHEDEFSSTVGPSFHDHPSPFPSSRRESEIDDYRTMPTRSQSNSITSPRIRGLSEDGGGGSTTPTTPVGTSSLDRPTSIERLPTVAEGGTEELGMISVNAPAPAVATPAPAAASSSASPSVAYLSSSSSSSTSSNPHASALAAALASVAKSSNLNPPPSASSLDAILAYLQSLAFPARSQFFTLASSSAPLFISLLAYFTNAYSGTMTDPMCKFLYDTYWEASTKMVATKGASTTNGTDSNLPSSHLFLINILPILLYRFMATYSTMDAAAQPGTSSSTGLFTVLLGIYNTERILSARGSNLLAASAPSIPDLPPNLPKTDLAGRRHLIMQPHIPTILPAISEPMQHTDLMIHVLLTKWHMVNAANSTSKSNGASSSSTSTLRQHVRQIYIYLIGLICANGQEDIFGLTVASVAPPTPASSTLLKVDWSTNWQSVTSSSFHSSRFPLSTLILQDFLLGISAALSNVSSSAEREFIATALRQIHCRAIEEMKPEILLQTTVMLEQVQLATK